MTKKSSPLKLGNETYGKWNIEKTFLKALEIYFMKQQESESSN
ncbi:hypothetical protein BCJMU51_4429 [Bacillus cereus]|nr:hypothetical protein [Bacillus cereus]BCB39510.1 hypothetical protein BCM0045_4405 [Bacillus cereus]BCC02351.1 hypothetical protein BCM0057_4433 [Bacillus cereus]BCC25863.1 hypothetical protein BCM0079_4456 [Bacillus cereus]BCC37431.1 hypothetical protein BCM0105_4421 [Bacillus cereus]BCC43233.1 hypothetical protein BCJMU01_4400 [Bacillus cereus]